MICEDYLILLDDLVEGELDAALTEQVNSHLLDCQNCAAKHDSLQQEKELYGQYFFYIEPPDDLLVNIHSKLHDKEFSEHAVILNPAPDWRAKILSFFRLYSLVTREAVVAVGLLLLLTINFAVWRLVTNKNDDESAKPLINAREISKPETPIAVDSVALSSEKADNPSSSSPAFIKTVNNPGKAGFEKALKIIGQMTPHKKYGSPGKARVLAKAEPRSLKLQNLEVETSNQIEKIEFLMRSFRNAQAAEDGETFDLTYEKQQARKLLEKNVLLRQAAENYGTLYAVDLLSKAEPMLLEIANLESFPEREKVLEIKERLRKKNLIVSLQAY